MRRPCKETLLAAALVAISNAPAFADDAKPAPGLREKLGQLLLVGFRGTEAASNSHVVRDVVRQGVGGVLLYERDGETRTRPRNIVGPSQTRRLVAGLQARAKVPLFVAIDQEGGLVARFKSAAGFASLPSAKLQGSLSEDSLMRSVLRSAQELAAAGVNVNFAPVVDLDVDTASKAVGALQRSFGRDAASVTRCARAFAKAQRGAGLLSTLKHFPGQGSARGDTHDETVDATESWSEKELVPFSVLIREGAADMVMMSHVSNRHLDGSHPASLSRATVDGVLRRKLSYQGVVVTDDLQMEAIRRHCEPKEAFALALEAGCDILLLGNSTRGPYDSSLVSKSLDALEDLVRGGRISEARIDSSWRRVLALKKRLPPPVAGTPMRILFVSDSIGVRNSGHVGSGAIVDEFRPSRNSSCDTAVFDSLLRSRPDAVVIERGTDALASWLKGRVERLYEAVRPPIHSLRPTGEAGSAKPAFWLDAGSWVPLDGQNPGRTRDVVEAMREMSETAR